MADYELCQNCGTVGSDCPACDGTGKVYSSPYVERLRAALRTIAQDSYGLGNCCLDTALSVSNPEARAIDLETYRQDHDDCTDAHCVACHAMGHPDPCLGGKA